jgi:hypothetical protein
MRILRELERLAAVRRQRKSAPYPRNRRLAHAQLPGQEAGAPMRSAPRHAFQGGCDHPFNLLVQDAARHARAGRIAQTFNALLGKASPPLAHRQVADAQAHCDSQIGCARLGARQHDAGTKRQALGSAAPTCPALQGCPIRIGQNDRYSAWIGHEGLLQASKPKSMHLLPQFRQISGSHH